MAKSKKLRVMISSKCESPFPHAGGRKLSEIRKDLKQKIEDIKVGETQIFEVWINEDEPPQGGRWDSWDVCLQAVRDCDILLVISNGESGWASTGEEIGICHAELSTGVSVAAGKVRLIQLLPDVNPPDVSITNDAEGARNKRFHEYVQKQNLFRGAVVTTEDELNKRVHEALADAVIALARAGSADSARGKYHSGTALDWTRLSFAERREQMVLMAKKALGAADAQPKADEPVVVALADSKVLVAVHAIPAALSVGAAKEPVGQPFLRDHQLSGHLTEKGGVTGPLHIIACNKTATEAQAMKLLGFPDATVVSPPFGIFVADPVQMVQFAFIKDCRDESTTRHGVQRFLEWLKQTGEDKLVARRAAHRANIVRAIAACQADNAPPAIGAGTPKAQAKKRAPKGGTR